MKNFAINIINDQVNILSLEKNNLVGILITNKNIADNFTSFFQQLWRQN